MTQPLYLLLCRAQECQISDTTKDVSNKYQIDTVTPRTSLTPPTRAHLRQVLPTSAPHKCSPQVLPRQVLPPTSTLPTSTLPTSTPPDKFSPDKCSVDSKVRSRIRETGGMWPFARQRCCPPGGYWYQSKALHLPDLITLTVRLQRRS